ncbi:MAG: hypothetical protein JSV00_02910, partial [bacterium]
MWKVKSGLAGCCVPGEKEDPTLRIGRSARSRVFRVSRVHLLGSWLPDPGSLIILPFLSQLY